MSASLLVFTDYENENAGVLASLSRGSEIKQATYTCEKLAAKRSMPQSNKKRKDFQRRDSFYELCKLGDSQVQVRDGTQTKNGKSAKKNSRKLLTCLWSSHHSGSYYSITLEVNAEELEIHGQCELLGQSGQLALCVTLLKNINSRENSDHYSSVKPTLNKAVNPYFGFHLEILIGQTLVYVYDRFPMPISIYAP